MMNIFFSKYLHTDAINHLETATEFDPGLVCVWASVLNYNMHPIHQDAQLGLMHQQHCQVSQKKSERAGE